MGVTAKGEILGCGTLKLRVVEVSFSRSRAFHLVLKIGRAFALRPEHVSADLYLKCPALIYT